MALRWRVGTSRTGPCQRCEWLDGRREGDGWSREPGSDQEGPPPLHEHCTCVIVDDADAMDEAAAGGDAGYQEWLEAVSDGRVRTNGEMLNKG